MAAKFTEEEDFHYLHRLAREANREERKQRKELIEFCDKRQAEKTARKETRERNAKANAEQIAKLDLILDKEKIPGLKGQHLKDQLKLFKNAGAPNLQIGKQPTLIADIRKTFLDAIDLYVGGIWKLIGDEESDGDEAEYSENDVIDDDDDDDENWENE